MRDVVGAAPSRLAAGKPTQHQDESGVEQWH